MLILFKSIFNIYPLLVIFAYFPSSFLQDQNSEILNKTDNNGYKQGHWIIKKNEMVIAEGNYINNKKDGIWKDYFENKKIKSEINYSNGEAKGTAKFFYKNGNVREVGNWQIDHWEGNYKYYFESGALSYDWYYNQNGKRQGEQKYFYANGEKMYEGFWENGKTEGVLKVYNDSGILIQEKFFNNGVFSELKEKNKDDAFIRNKQFNGTGFHTILNIQGNIDEKGFFIKGNLHNGKKYNYDENDSLISIYMFENGRNVGTQHIKKKP